MESKKRAGYILVMGIALAILIVFIFVNYREEHSFDLLNDFSYGWIDVDENGITQEITLPSKERKVNSAQYTMSHKLPEVTSSSLACAFKSENIFFHAYIDDILIYEFTNKDMNYGNTPGDRWNIILLPQWCSGKDLRIETQVIYPQGSNFIKKIYLGEYGEIIKALLRKNIAGFIQCILLIVVSTIFIVINELLIAKMKNDHTLTRLAIFTDLLSLWLLSQTPITYFLVSSPYLIQLMTYVSLPLAAGVISDLFSKKCEGIQSILFRILSLGCYVQATLCVVLDLLDIYNFPESILITQILYTLIFIVFLFKNIKEFIKLKKQNVSYYIMLGANLFLGFMCFIDLYLSYSNATDDYSKNTRIGLLVFISCIGMDKIMEFWDYIKVVKESEIMKKLAYVDGLTEVGNRTAFNHRLASLMKEKSSKTGFVHFDINNLKLANDKYGHLVGDELIKSAARLIYLSFESIGECYRYGGDEFTVIITGELLKNIEQGIKNLQVNQIHFNYNNQLLPVKVSLAYGNAVYDKSKDSTLLDTLNRADEDMYIRKKQMK